MKRLPFAPIAVALALAVVFSGACTTHGEGGRCDFHGAGNADCDPGLVCVPGGDIALPEGGTSGADICCPSPRVIDDTICSLNPNTPGSDASFPEGGFPDVNVADVSVDQTVSDSATDASTDAAEESDAIEESDAPTDATGD